MEILTSLYAFYRTETWRAHESGRVNAKKKLNIPYKYLRFGKLVLLGSSSKLEKMFGQLWLKGLQDKPIEMEGAVRDFLFAAYDAILHVDWFAVGAYF